MGGREPNRIPGLLFPFLYFSFLTGVNRADRPKSGGRSECSSPKFFRKDRGREILFFEIGDGTVDCGRNDYVRSPQLEMEARRQRDRGRRFPWSAVSWPHRPVICIAANNCIELLIVITALQATALRTNYIRDTHRPP